MRTLKRLCLLVCGGLGGLLLLGGSADAQPYPGGLPQCNADLQQTQTNLGICAANLTQTQTNLGICAADLTQTRTDLTLTRTSLEICVADLREAQTNLTQVFRYTGFIQNFTIPNGVSSIYVELWSAGGGGGSGSPVGRGVFSSTV